MARSRLIDLTLAGVRYDVMKAALDILTTAPEFDLVVVVVGSSARFYPELAVQPIIDVRAAPATRMAVFLVPGAPQARAHWGGPASPISIRRKPAPTPLPRRWPRAAADFCLARGGAGSIRERTRPLPGGGEEIPR